MRAMPPSKSSFRLVRAGNRRIPRVPHLPTARIKTILFPRIRYGIILNYKQLLRAERRDRPAELIMQSRGRVNSVNIPFVKFDYARWLVISNGPVSHGPPSPLPSCIRNLHKKAPEDSSVSLFGRDEQTFVRD